MAEHILAISGIRDLHPESIPAVQRQIRQEALRATEIRFGGARGADTVALWAVRSLAIRRVVYVPFKLADQPKAARTAIEQCATRVIEMDLERCKAAYLARTRSMLLGAHRLLAITDGRTDGGTAYAINFAKINGIDYHQLGCVARTAPTGKQTELPLD